MGYRGNLEAQAKARDLRAAGHKIADIADTLDVSRSSVSLWVRDVPFVPTPRRPTMRRAHPQHMAKIAEIAECDRAAVERIGTPSPEAFFAAGVALYAGEGTKRDGGVEFANADPMMIAFFCRWLRASYPIDEKRLGSCVSPRRAGSRCSRGFLVRVDPHSKVSISVVVPSEG